MLAEANFELAVASRCNTRPAAVFPDTPPVCGADVVVIPAVDVAPEQKIDVAASVFGHLQFHGVPFHRCHWLVR